MIRRKDEMKTYDRPAMKGGAGKAVLTDLLDASEMMDKGRLYSIITLDPGCSIGTHTHEGEAEIFYILEGEATAHDNGKEVVLKPGDLLCTGDGDSHDVKNAGDTTMRLLALILYK